MKKLFVCALFIHTLYTTDTPYTINMFIKEYPYEKIDHQNVHIEPFFAEKSIMKHAFYQPVITGVYGAYNGYLAASNKFGLLSFPRKTLRERFTLIITPSIKPSFLLNNTIDRWYITDPQNTAMFQVTRHKDFETKLYYWKVQQLHLPNEFAIPLHSIIILAKAHNIYVPLGITVTKKLPNLVLPPIYAKRGLDHIKQSFFVLNIKQFFAPTKHLTQHNEVSQRTIVST
jgi:hypothetical protein